MTNGSGKSAALIICSFNFMSSPWEKQYLWEFLPWHMVWGHHCLPGTSLSGWGLNGSIWAMTFVKDAWQGLLSRIQSNHLSTECTWCQGNVGIHLLMQRIGKWICNASCSISSILLRIHLVITSGRFEVIVGGSDHDSSTETFENYITMKIAPLSVIHV